MSEAAKSYQGKLTQAEANYVPISPTKGKACATCRWFMGHYNECAIVQSYPEPIYVTGISDRWEATPPPPPELSEIVSEAVAEAVADTIDNLSTTITTSFPPLDMGKEKKTITQRFREFFASKRAPVVDDAFEVMKDTDGVWHWHAVYTNNYEDLEGEILTEKAHDRYIKRLDMGVVPMPVLQAWHTPGTEHGEADVVWRSGHFVHAIGHFYDTPIAKKAIAFYQKNHGKIKNSHGFVVPEKSFDGKHYDDYNTIEITTLPPHAAANPFTSFEELKAMAMKDMSAEKRTYIESFVGKEGLAALEAKDTDREKMLSEMAVNFKDFVNPDPTPAAPATPATPATPSAAAPAAAPDIQKAWGVVYTDLVETDQEVLKQLTLASKALKLVNDQVIQLKADNVALKEKFDTETAAWQGVVDQLQEALNMPIERASQSTSTLLSAPEQDKLKDLTPTVDSAIKFFGGKEKPAEGALNL